MPGFDRELVHHGLNGRLLVFAAERHEPRARADGGVEPLGQAALGADVQIARECGITVGEMVGDFFLHAPARGGHGGDVLFRTVRVEKRAGQVNDGFAVPAHDETGRLRDGGDGRDLQIFALRQLAEPRGILRRDHDGHALLRFADGKLRAVQPVVLAGHGVEVNI